MKKIAIIDDNKAARDSLKNILEHNYTDKFEIREANSVLSGHGLILDFQPNIVLLDIEMGDGTGLDLVGLFPEISFDLIFITAHKEYALKAIKHKPHDYLLKPVNPFDLMRIINQLLTETITNTTTNMIDKIVVKNQNATILIDVTTIIRFEADGAYTKIITEDAQHMASKNLKHFDQLLSNQNFLRVHHAHLINLNHIKLVNRHAQTGIVLKNGDKIPVSTRKVKDITDFIDNLGG